MDNLKKEQRSVNMAAIRAKNTSPEIKVRKELYSSGLRYRLHADKLPGKPDILFSKEKLVIFIHGCFWHCHAGCKRSNMPKTNKLYWKDKIHGNVYRDKHNNVKLKELGYKVLTIWECQIKNKNNINNLIKKINDYKKDFELNRRSSGD